MGRTRPLPALAPPGSWGQHSWALKNPKKLFLWALCGIKEYFGSLKSPNPGPVCVPWVYQFVIFYSEIRCTLVVLKIKWFLQRNGFILVPGKCGVEIPSVFHLEFGGFCHSGHIFSPKKLQPKPGWVWGQGHPWDGVTSSRSSVALPLNTDFYFVFPFFPHLPLWTFSFWSRRLSRSSKVIFQGRGIFNI